MRASLKLAREYVSPAPEIAHPTAQPSNLCPVRPPGRPVCTHLPSSSRMALRLLLDMGVSTVPNTPCRARMSGNAGAVISSFRQKLQTELHHLSLAFQGLQPVTGIPSHPLRTLSSVGDAAICSEPIRMGGPDTAALLTSPCCCCISAGCCCPATGGSGGGGDSGTGINSQGCNNAGGAAAGPPSAAGLPPCCAMLLLQMWWHDAEQLQSWFVHLACTLCLTSRAPASPLAILLQAVAAPSLHTFPSSSTYPSMPMFNSCCAPAPLPLAAGPAALLPATCRAACTGCGSGSVGMLLGGADRGGSGPSRGSEPSAPTISPEMSGSLSAAGCTQAETRDK